MAPKNEAQDVKAIVRAVQKKYPDAWVFKVVGNPYQMTGVPDLILSVHGVLIGLEVKHRRPGESIEAAFARATPGQMYQLRKISQSGGYGAVVLGADSALIAIEQALSEHGGNWAQRVGIQSA